MTTATALALADATAIAECKATIAAGSRSFALASRLLPARARDHAAMVYAWCRAVDDAVDLAPPGEAAQALAGERAEIDAIYRGAPARVSSRAFAAVVRARAVPEAYPAALLDGMAMDVAGARYHTVEDLFTYAYRVAGVVGLTMCHVLGVRDDDALVPAVHLGVAMQLTNVCRDVAEDWARDRLYLPDEVLARHGAAGLAGDLGRPLPASAQPAVRATVLELLALADRYYRSARAGHRALPWRASAGVRAAGRIYRAIGTVLVRRGGDALAGRAVVGSAAKLGHVAAAAGATLASAPSIAWQRLRGRTPRVPTRVLELAHVPRL